ncbi:MAG: hypothetical protein J5802_09085 [Butyrivibrio sp.]|nr:hypothetical protein [Butyrivibrio sp.]
MSKYNKIMDNVVVTEDMKNRILQNIEKELDDTENDDKIVHIESMTNATLKNGSSSDKFSYMRWVNLAAAAAVIVVSGVAVRNVILDSNTSSPTYNSAVKTEANSESMYPADYDRSEAASDTAQEAEAAEDIQSDAEATAQAVWDSKTYATLNDLSAAVGFDVKECTSFDAEETEYRSIGKDLAQITYKTQDNEICVRQMQGDVEFIDISGDYEQYDDIIDEEVAGKTVTLRGFGDSFKSASWADGSSTFVISLENAVPKEAMMELVKKFLM